MRDVKHDVKFYHIILSLIMSLNKLNGSRVKKNIIHKVRKVKAVNSN